MPVLAEPSAFGVEELPFLLYGACAALAWKAAIFSLGFAIFWFLGTHYPEAGRVLHALLSMLMVCSLVFGTPCQICRSVLKGIHVIITAFSNGKYPEILEWVAACLSMMLAFSLTFARSAEYAFVVIVTLEPGVYGLKGYYDGTHQAFLKVIKNATNTHNKAPMPSLKSTEAVWTVTPRLLYRRGHYGFIREEAIRVRMTVLKAIEEVLRRGLLETSSNTTVQQSSTHMQIMRGVLLYKNSTKDVIVTILRECLSSSVGDTGVFLVKEVARRLDGQWRVNKPDIDMVDFDDLNDACCVRVADENFSELEPLVNPNGGMLLVRDAAGNVLVCEEYVRDLAIETARLTSHLNFAH